MTPEPQIQDCLTPLGGVGGSTNVCSSCCGGGLSPKLPTAAGVILRKTKLGRVCMDLITIDVTGAQALAKPGAFAQFIGPEILLEDQARRAGTVGYELVTGLGHRVRRIYD